MNGVLLGFRVRYRELHYDRLRSFTVRTVNSPSSNWADLTGESFFLMLTHQVLLVYVQKVVLFTLLWCYQQGLQCALQNNIVLPLSQSCEPPLFSQPRPFSIQTPAPYSIRNLSESSLTQYELDSKSHISLCAVRLHVICCIVPPQIMPFVW